MTLQVVHTSGVMEPMRVGEKIYLLCKLRGLKVAELARQTGIPQQRFSDWKDSTEDRPRLPTLPQALRVARALSVPLDYLADDTQETPPPPEDEGVREVMRNVSRLGAEEVMRRIVAAAVAFKPSGSATMARIEPPGAGSQSGGEPANHQKRAKR